MDEELLLKQPADRRLENENLPPGPPGIETDEYDSKKDDKDSSSKSSRRKSHSPSPSSTKRRGTPQRSRRSPSPRRNRKYRYSPDRRGRFDRRRSPDRDRRRSPAGRDRNRDRYRRRREESASRSRSRSNSPPSRRGVRGNGRWSPKNQPSSPPPPPPQTSGTSGGQTMMPSSTGVTQYSMMQAPQTQLYGNDTYATYGAPYGVPTQHAGFNSQPDGYSMPATVTYNAGYPPPTWRGHDGYTQQQAWMQPTNVSEHNSQIPQATKQAAHSSGSNFSANNNRTSTEITPVESHAAHDAAVAQEAENQREELKKQRTSYVKKNTLLKKELKMLKDQRKDLDSGKAPLSPTTKGFVDENEKLQSQILKKIATIENVIEMLTGVIGEEHVDREELPVTHKADNKDRANIGAKVIDSSAGKVIPQIKVEHKDRTVSTSSNSSRDEGQGPATSSGTSSTSSSSSTSDSSSSSDEEEKRNDNIKPAIRPIVIKEEEEDDSSPERLKHKVMESMKSKQKTINTITPREVPTVTDKSKSEKIAVEKKEHGHFNYAFYDPEMHWCQRCNVFPKSAKDYLNHLHSIEHLEKERAPETPWHSTVIEDNFANYENAPTKRMPIRGITFFVPATAWYCKLCCIWMGDLHCASMHLKSRKHSNKYATFLERNPNFEMNWLADRQRVLNEKNSEAAAPQITAVSTTAGEDRDYVKSKKTEDKSSKHKRNTEKKDKKKKKKRNKKRKKAAESSSESSSSDSASSSEESDQAVQKKKKIPKVASPVKELNNPNPSASIRVAMRKSNRDDNDVPPPPPPSISLSSKAGQASNWNVIKEGSSGKSGNDSKPEDAMMQQWNTVQPVISDNEKKLLEQLKGKLKTTKPTSKDSKDGKVSDSKENRESKTERSKDNRREIDTSNNRYRTRRSRSRSASRSPTRSRSRGRDYRRARSRSMRRRSRSRARRTRSRSRGRFSLERGGRRRRSPSRSRRRRTRSRSRNRRARRSRTRSGSRSAVTITSAPISRVEKAVVQHSEFRPRVPEKDKDKEKEKKSTDSKDKKETKKATKSNSNSSTATTGKKLPFIGKMPVFKKQSTGQNESEPTTDASATSDMSAHNLAAAFYISQTSSSGIQPVPPPPPPRTQAPTAAQINMAMMEDAFGNAPPFHPEAGVMHANMDYDDLMPDPVQFVNLMAQAPPPPAEEAENTDDVLPPGIDEMETEVFVPKPRPEVEDDDGNLPQDLEEALNIIFPGEKKPESDDESAKPHKDSGETQIIVEEPVMQVDQLYKEGIHMVTVEETSLMAMDEASRLSMNEPLVFNKSSSITTHKPISQTDEKLEQEPILANSAPTHTTKVVASTEIEETKEIQNSILIETNNIQETSCSLNKTDPEVTPIPDEIPMPPVAGAEVENTVESFNLDDIPHPPAPLTESEKKRRQEQLDELAMLGIDADDMAAQRM